MMHPTYLSLIFGGEEDVSFHSLLDSWPIPTPIRLQGGALVYQWSPKTRDSKPHPHMLQWFAPLTDASDEQILKFARKNGVLGLCEHGRPVADAHTGRFCELPGYSKPAIEPLANWREYARAAVAVLNIAISLNRDEMADPTEWEVLKACPLTATWSKALRLDSVDSHRDALWGVLNNWLRASGLGPKCVVENSGKNKVFAIRLGPSLLACGLFSALSLELAYAVAHGMFFQCAACRRFYKRERRPTSGSNTFCFRCGRGKKGAWRAASQKYRDARKRAWALHADDKTPEQIARELDRELSTVQGWLRLIPKGERKR